MPSIGLEPSEWLLVVVVTLLSALVQGTVGFGSAVLAVPLLSLVDPRLAPVPQMLSVLPLTVWAALREWSRVDWGGVGWVLLGRVPGLGLGMLLLSLANERVLDGLIGGLVLLSVMLLWLRPRLTRSALTDCCAGAISGAAGYVSGIGGPPLALLFRAAAGPTIRASLGVLFAIGLVLTLTARAVTGHMSVLDLKLALCLVGPTLAGMWASRFLHPWLKGARLEVAVLSVSACAALGLLGRAAWPW